MLKRSIKKTADILNRSFGFRLFVVSVAVVSAILILFTTITIVMEQRLVREELLEKGKIFADLLESGSRSAIFSESADLLRDAAEVVLEQEYVKFVSIHDAKGKTLFFSYGDKYGGARSSGESEFPAEYFSITGAQTERAVYEKERHFEFMKPVKIQSYPEEGEVLFFTDIPVDMKEQVIGYVRVAIEGRRLESIVENIIIRNGIVTALILVFCVVIFIQIVRRITTPLVHLTEGVKHIASGEPIGHMPEGTDEIGRLGKAFNDMADDLRGREEENSALQEKLYQAKKLEAIGTLARGLAHDFNNIIGAVKGNVYLLKKKMDPDHPLHAFVSNMEPPLAKASDLIDSLMTFSKGRVPKPLLLDMNAIISKMRGTIRSLLHEDINYVEAVCDGPMPVIADPMQMEQVILNLVSNARDAMTDGGTLTIETRIIHMGPAIGKERMDRNIERYGIITFSDTGTGMNKDIRDRIFEPFFTTKDVGEGTGLGLSIIHSIVEAHNGFIDCESTEGKGTVFTLYLPIAEERETPDSAGA